MRNIHQVLLVAIFGGLFLQGCSSASTNDAVLLKFNLQRDKEYVYSMNMDMENDVQGQKMKTDMDFDYSLQVLAEKDSIKTVKTTFDRIAMKMNAGAMNVDFDTDQPKADSAANGMTNPNTLMRTMFYAMKGQSFSMRVNPAGEVIEVAGLTDLQNAMTASLGADENVRQIMTQAFNAQFNEENIKKSFSQAFNIYPEKPVKVGDTWTKKTSIGGMTAGDMNTTYKVKTITADQVTLDVASTIESAQLKGQQTGTMELNREDGMVKSATLEQKFGAPMPMTTRMTITGKQK